MAIDAGSIEYDIHVGTEGVLKAQNAVEKSTKQIAKELAATEKAERKLAKETAKAAKEVEAAKKLVVAAQKQAARDAKTAANEIVAAERRLARETAKSAKEVEAAKKLVAAAEKQAARDARSAANEITAANRAVERSEAAKAREVIEANRLVAASERQAARAVVEASRELRAAEDRRSRAAALAAREIVEANRLVAASERQAARVTLAASRTSERSSDRARVAATRSSRETSRGLQNSSRSMGQAGIQVQQLVGQVQGGQNVMQAFAMQSADLGIVLGAPLVGVVASLSFALGSALAPALFNGKSAMEELEATTERLKATISLSSEGVAEYSDKMEQLAIVSKGLVKTQLALTIIEQNKAFKQSAEVLNDATQSATGFINLFGSFDGVVTELTGKELGKEGFDEARGALLEFKREVAAFNLKPTALSADVLTEAINRLAKAGGTATKEGQELLQLAVDQVSLFQQGKITLDKLNESLNNTSKASSILESKSKDLVSALEMEAATLGFTDRALALHTAHLKGATQAEYDAINASFDKIESFKAEAEALKIKTAAEKQAAKAAETAAKSKIKAAETAAKSKIKAAERARIAEAKKVETKALSISSSVEDPLAKLQRQKNEELEIIRLAEERGLTLHQEYSVLRGEIDKKFAEQEMVAREAKFRAESDGNAFMLDSINALGAASTNVIAGMLSGTMSATEAMQGFANIILNEAVGALVSVGVQYLKNAVIKSTADQAMLVSEQATKAASAAAHTAAVTASVAELVSLAALGAFAATAAIPLVGPVLAGPAAAAAAGVAGGIGAGAIASAPLAGMRQYGGDVNANSMYRVGEAGPEIFQTQSGQNMMIPGENGKVLSNADSTAAMGGGPMEVVVNNYGSPVDVKVSQTEKQIIIDMTLKAVAGQISSNQGVVPSALKNGSNYQTKANR